MAKIAFTSHLQKVGPSDPVTCEGATVGSLIAALDERYPLLRNYILDDQGRVRQHIAIFVDGEMRPRDTVLADPVNDASEVYVLQALSGG